VRATSHARAPTTRNAEAAAARVILEADKELQHGGGNGTLPSAGNDDTYTV
jgi:hypothetical protein